MAVSENKQPQGLFNQLLRVLNDTAPRTIEATRKLQGYGLGLLAIKLSRISIVIGMRIDEIPLPEHARIICVGRDDQALYPADDGRLAVGDTIFVLHEQGREAQIREIFTSPAPVCDITQPDGPAWPPDDLYDVGPQPAD